MLDRISKKELFLLLAALAYLVSPLDAIPEIIAGPLGLVDDAAVVAMVTALIIQMFSHRTQPETVKAHSTRVS